VGLILVAGLACSRAETRSQAQTIRPPADDVVVAEVGGRTITMADLEARWQEMDPVEQARVEQLVYQSRRNVLEQMVGDLLIEDAAKAAGLSSEAYLEKETAVRLKPPTEADIQQFYEQNKDRASGRSFDELKEPITAFLTSQREQQARAQIVDELRKKGAVVRVTLDPPRRDVGLASHDPVRGPENAPITIIEFSDFQCPYCGRVTPTLAKLQAAYPDKIRIVFKDFPLPNHELAPKAAEAAHCASEQDKYWEMHDRLFANQRALDVPALKASAGALGLDQTAFDTCLDSGKFADIVQADVDEGTKLGIQSTPTLYVNGRPVVGAQPYEYFVTVVEEELARVR
jgi:protein-disulfide isomerase